MKKIIILILLIFSASVLFAQDNFDVRKTKWGMPKSEVISSEYPLHPVKFTDNAKYNESILFFENVELNNSLTADIYYKFSNGKLINVRYGIYGTKYFDTRGTCDNIIPFINKVQLTKSIFEALKLKGFNFDKFGWYFNHLPTIIRENGGIFYESSLNYSILSILEKTAAEKNFCQIGIVLEKDRTIVEVAYNEYQNCKIRLDENKLLSYSCNNDFYNIYCWLDFSPNYQVLQKLKEKDF